MSVKKKIHGNCPICEGGDLSFDYYDSSIRCLQCEVVWVVRDKMNG